MSLLWEKNCKKSTILRAVPETPTAPQPDQREDMQNYMQTNDAMPHTLGTYTTPSPARSDSFWRKKRKNSIPRSISPGISPISDSKSLWRHASLKGTIGTYRHGKIQWKNKKRSPSGDGAKHGQKAERKTPKIQVVIPSGRMDQPLPSLPFFTNPSKRQLQTNSIETGTISPGSASHMFMRDSIVSPLSQHQLQSLPFGHDQRTMAESNFPSPQHQKHASESSDSSNASQQSDTTSLRSNGISDTSFERDTSPTQEKAVNSSMPFVGSHAPGPSAIGQSILKSGAKIYHGKKHRNLPPATPPRRYMHQPLNGTDFAFEPTCQRQPVRCASHEMICKPTLTRKSSKRNSLQPTFVLAPNTVMEIVPSRSMSRQLSDPLKERSITLSEAENDLNVQLASITVCSKVQIRTALTEGNPSNPDDLIMHKPRSDSGHGDSIDVVGERGSANVSPLDTPPPILPRKSSKRQSAARTAKVSHLSSTASDHIVSQMARGRSRVSRPLTLKIPECQRNVVEQILSPLPSSTRGHNPIITRAGAETVLLGILRNLDHFQDLFDTALINKGFYRVFKLHELDLIKSTLWKMSPPAWEFREIAFPGHDLLRAEDLEVTRPIEEYTPITYLQLQRQDIQVICDIKSHMVEKCQSFVRQEISIALASVCPIESSRVDQALWRIWTFCKVFGSGKGREEDIVAQMDWLNGGELAHQSTCTLRIVSTDYMSSDTLVSVPDCFAKGNEGGLSAEELFDMLELWNCLCVLLQGFEGRTVQARQAGVYDNTDIRGGDIDGEEVMLDEWCYHLLTFGPATVLKLTGPYHPSDNTPFQIAAKYGWINWRPPVFGGSRRNFLKEAASRVYEDKIAHTYAQISTRDVQRQQSRMRQQKLVVELLNRKKNIKRGPTISMSQERPMSEWDTVIRNLTRPPPLPVLTNNIVSHVPTLHSSTGYIQVSSASVSELPASRPPSPPRRTVPQPLLPTPSPTTVPSSRDRYSIITSLPSIEEHAPLPSRRTVPQPILPSPSVSTLPSHREILYAIPRTSTPPRRTVPQPLLPTPSPSTIPSRDHFRYSIATSMPSIEEHPAHRDVPEIPSLACHPAFRRSPSPMPPHHTGTDSDVSAYSQGSNSSDQRGLEHTAFHQHAAQRSIYGSESHENTAEKAIYRIVEMGFTTEQAREALRTTDLGTGLRVDHAVELLLSRQG